MINIREIRDIDMPLIRRWRNHDRKWFHDQTIITEAMQNKWHERYLRDASDMLFIAETERVPVGMYGLININQQNAEAGRLIIGEKGYTGKSLSTEIMRSVLRFGFEELLLDGIYTDVKAKNKAAAITMIKAGYEIVGFRMFQAYGVVHLNITKEEFQKSGG